MGVNIYAYKIAERNEDGKIPATEIDFDTDKYAGDRDFMSSLDWDCINEYENVFMSDVMYCRPQNIEKAKDWVLNNLPEGNQPRLLNLLDKMADDESIYIYFSV